MPERPESPQSRQSPQSPIVDRPADVSDLRGPSAARVVAFTFGVAAGILGFEHGYFESMQGHSVPAAFLISAIGPPCDPATVWHACEPAFTLIPSFLITGLIAMGLSMVVLVWAATLVQRRNGGLVLLGLSVALFLVGGGFATLLFGVLAGIAGTRIGAPPTSWKTRMPPMLLRTLARLWPWLLIVYLAWFAYAWLIASVFGDFMLALTPAVTVLTPVVLILILASGLAYDVESQPTKPRQGPARPTNTTSDTTTSKE